MRNSVTENCSLSLSQLLVNTITKSLDWTDDTNLPVELMNDSVIWDAAHRLELACKHAKEGYTVKGQKIGGGASWLLELDMFYNIS